MSLPIRQLMGKVGSYTGFFIEPIEQWSQFFERCNWYDFTFIKFDVEDDRIMGGVECTLVLLGLGFRARWNYARTERVDEIARSVEEIKAALGSDDSTP